jgi:hypothetical protein
MKQCNGVLQIKMVVSILNTRSLLNLNNWIEYAGSPFLDCNERSQGNG